MMHCEYCNYVAQILVKQLGNVQTCVQFNDNYKEISRGLEIRSVELLIPLKERHL